MVSFIVVLSSMKYLIAPSLGYLGKLIQSSDVYALIRVELIAPQSMILRQGILHRVSDYLQASQVYGAISVVYLDGIRDLIVP